MAAAEARAVWQRTANRYFIQEDAKRAPKLASISSVVSKIEAKPVDHADLNDSFPVSGDKSFYSSLESDSKWWLQLQPDYMYQRGLTSEQQYKPNPHQFVENQDGSISSVDSLSSKGSYEFVQMDSVELPWWKMVEKNDFDSFGSNKSHFLIENCDLHGPMHSGLEPQKIKCGRKDISPGESRPDTSKTKILEALCHSQTRAREAEIAAKKAYAEREHAIKLVFKQASQLFAYRQWIYILQLENLCYQNKNKGDQLMSVCAFSSSKIGKLDKNMKKVMPTKGKRRRTKRWFGRYERNLGKYAVVFVVGLGIVGAGLLLGWTVGWMLI
ncbi:hypothetical protein M8C21_002016 [Ambrosia artemisiifolia]|uniref:Uncharacterized protein n=1 Tax=Ambrosia artemisiifolia TaxID=4212 RepID=A0AAD5G475_AMBAR|nr:hypothetical protein M8C21_002016 [Ambrosia artemisiifolia]